MAGMKGRSGRKMVPTAIKLLRGTVKRQRINHDEPGVIEFLHEPPDDLDDAERVAYLDWLAVLVKLGTMSAEHRNGLRDLACSDVRVVRARRAAKTNGMVQVIDGKSSQSGWARELDAARTDFHRLCGVFGVTPADKARVRAEVQVSAEPTEQDIQRERFFG